MRWFTDRSLSLALGVLTCGVMSGCGLILGGGSSQTIQVVTTPEGATFTTAPPTSTYTTPASISLQRKNAYGLTFQMTGYSSATSEIQTNVRVGYVVADVLLTGLVGVVVDAVTGGWSALSPETATVSLTKTAMIDGPDRIDVFVMRNRTRDGVVVQSTEPGVSVRVRVM